MKITFDVAKSEANRRTRQLSFECVAELDFLNALHFVDERKDYGEVRRIAVGYIEQRLHVVCYTWREDNLHVISLRKANAKEAKRYGKAKKITD